MIKFVIEQGASMNVTRLNGDTLLQLAMGAEIEEEERLKRVKTLVNIGCDPRAQCNLAGTTRFYIAASQGYISVMEYLPSLGILAPSDVMVTQFEGFHGVEHRHFTIPFLMDQEGDIHTVAHNGHTLLHLAAGLYPEEVASELTTHLVHVRCIPCVPNYLQETPLHVPARSEFISVIKYLLSQHSLLIYYSLHQLVTP